MLGGRNKQNCELFLLVKYELLEGRVICSGLAQ
jgi:hypothetical protein